MADHIDADIGKESAVAKGMYFQADFWEAARYLPEAERKDFAYACLKLFFDGEECDLDDTVKAMFTLVRDRIELSKKRSKASNSRRSNIKTTSKHTSNAHQNAHQNSDLTPPETHQACDIKTDSDLLKKESEKEKENENKTTTTTARDSLRDDGGGGGGGGGGWTAFLVECMEAYNAAMGQDVLVFPLEAREGVKLIYETGRTLEDVKKVLKWVKAEWEPRYITPKSVFGDRFETNLSRCAPQRAAPDRNWPPSLPCPMCGEESAHVDGAVYVCHVCDTAWESDWEDDAV